MKINTKELIFRDLHILAVFSQNMVFDDKNVMTFTHNIGSEERFYEFHENQHFSVDFRTFRICVTGGSRKFGRFERDIWISLWLILIGEHFSITTKL
jgi:hypothetical protein